jgi:hypothetical protein
MLHHGHLNALHIFAALGALHAVRAANELVGPGALTRQGGGGGRRGGGWGVVDKWPVGFVVAGSSLFVLNGLYEVVTRDALVSLVLVGLLIVES